MSKQHLSVRVICINPPISCAGFSDLKFGVQDKDKQLLSGTEIAADECRFEFQLMVKQHSDGSPNFTGTYAHGSRAKRFLYLTLMGLANGTWEIIRRIKVPLKTITWEQVQEVLDDDGRRLQVKVSGETTGTVPLLDDGWIVK